MRRWRLLDAPTHTHVIIFRGKPVREIKHGLARAAERAGIKHVTPHMLKHTAITWAIMNGTEIQDAAEFFNTTEKTIRDHYWHYSPHHQARTIAIIEGRNRNQPVRKTVHGGLLGV
jgi:integrase